MPRPDPDRVRHSAGAGELLLEAPEFLAALELATGEHVVDGVSHLVADELVLRNEVVRRDRDHGRFGRAHRAATSSSSGVATPSSRPRCTSASNFAASIGTP